MFNLEQRKLIELQPLVRIQAFGRLLGWNGLRMDCFPCPDPNYRGPLGLFFLYSTTDRRFNLQISRRLDIGENGYTAAVIAERYGIIAVPHQSFVLHESDLELRVEADRLRAYFDRRNFKDAQWRRRFAEENPRWIMRQYRRRNKFLASIRRRAVASRNHSAFLRGYSPEDEGLYDDLPATESASP
jgi:hypothetical protein